MFIRDTELYTAENSDLCETGWYDPDTEDFVLECENVLAWREIPLLPEHIRKQIYDHKAERER